MRMGMQEEGKRSPLVHIVGSKLRLVQVPELDRGSKRGVEAGERIDRHIFHAGREALAAELDDRSQ